MYPKLNPVCKDQIAQQLTGYIPDKSVTRRRELKQLRRKTKKSAWLEAKLRGEVHPKAIIYIRQSNDATRDGEPKQKKRG